MAEIRSNSETRIIMINNELWPSIDELLSFLKSNNFVMAIGLQLINCTLDISLFKFANHRSLYKVSCKLCYKVIYTSVL